MPGKASKSIPTELPKPLPLLVCMYGLPRSGKSTTSRLLSRELGAPIVNCDSIRLALHGQAYAKEAELMVKAICKIMVHSLFLAGHEIVIADETNFSKAKRDFMKDGPWRTEFYEVPTPKEICIRRAIDTNQPYLVPVIEEMALRVEPLQDDEKRFPVLAYQDKTSALSGVKSYTCPIGILLSCPRCMEFATDTIDRKIYHENGHVWPGFAGDPS